MKKKDDPYNLFRDLYNPKEDSERKKRRIKKAIALIASLATTFAITSKRMPKKMNNINKQINPPRIEMQYDENRKSTSYNSLNLANTASKQILKNLPSNIAIFMEREKKYDKFFEYSSKTHHIPKEYLISIASEESSMGALSDNIMQITPIAEEEIKMKYKNINIDDPKDNIDGAGFLISFYYKMIDSDLKNYGYTPKNSNEELDITTLAYRYGITIIRKGILYFNEINNLNGNVPKKLKEYLGKEALEEGYDNRVMEMYEKITK